MKEKTVKNKKMTIDGLAGIMSKGFVDINKKFVNVNKMITEGREETNDLAIMVANGFERVDKEFGEVRKEFGEVRKEIAEVKKDVAEVKENLATTRMDVLGIGDRFVSKHEFSQHLIRFSLLEQKIKTKK